MSQSKRFSKLENDLKVTRNRRAAYENMAVNGGISFRRENALRMLNDVRLEIRKIEGQITDLKVQQGLEFAKDKLEELNPTAPATWKRQRPRTEALTGRALLAWIRDDIEARIADLQAPQGIPYTEAQLRLLNIDLDAAREHLAKHERMQANADSQDEADKARRLKANTKGRIESIENRIADLIAKQKLLPPVFPPNIQPSVVPADIQPQIQSTAQSNPQSKKYPVFISYCWKNSKTAVAENKIEDGKVGGCDPRNLARKISGDGFETWLDVEKLDAGLSLSDQLPDAIYH
ncbi:hypothetical protein HK100_008144, partial [Physocladia obscura]